MDWYKHNAKDFLEGTADMKNLEVGIYIRLLDHQFSRNGYLPNDFYRLCALVIQNDNEQAALRNVLSSKFRLHKRGYCNLRMLKTVREARQFIESRRLAGTKGGQASAQARATAKLNQRARARRASTVTSTVVVVEGGVGGVGGVEIPESLAASPAFVAAWSEWLAFRRDTRWSTKAAWAERQLAMLAKHGPDVAAAALDMSMAQGWQSVWPAKVRSEDGNADPNAPERIADTGYYRCRADGCGFQGPRGDVEKHYETQHARPVPA